MPTTAERLHALLTDLDAPDRLERPRVKDPEVVEEHVARLAHRLEHEFDCRCAHERLPAGADHHGSITLPAEAVHARLPVTVLIGRYGLTAALVPTHRTPAGDTVPLTDDELARVRTAVMATGFGFAHPVSSLTPSRPAPPRRLLDARTAAELTDQILRLPTDEADREPAELRDRLCRALGLPAEQRPGNRLDALDVLTRDQVLAEVERLTACLTALELPEDAEERRWLAIDDEILAGRNIYAIKAVRDEFRCSLKDAVERFSLRVEALRRTRPHGHATRKAGAR
ncbi:hypothetical protein ACQPZF_27780 [Actinosynnema sp. CS-041913]|uniref:hypothetical protein n=1 Tax=Actinosynnema sp. CS-041913 TaxID=3239917 RepID=UPI003D8CB10F